MNTSRDFSCTELVEESDILTENSFEIAFTDTLGGHFAGIGPDVHVDICDEEHADTKDDKVRGILGGDALEIVLGLCEVSGVP